MFSKTKKGFTLIELLVVISIVALLLSIMMPSLRKAREAARRTMCATNLRQWHIALENYAADHRGKLPSVYSCVYPNSLNMPAYLQKENYGANSPTYIYFGNSIYPYIQGRELGRCPSNATLKKFPDLDLWAQNSAGEFDQDGSYWSQYSFFIDSLDPDGNFQYRFADGHGYIQSRVPAFDGSRKGNLILAQDNTYALGKLLSRTHPGLSMFNHANSEMTVDTFNGAGSKTAYVRQNAIGANTLYLPGNVSWTRSEDMVRYAAPGNAIVGYLFFPESGPGANEVR